MVPEVPRAVRRAGFALQGVAAAAVEVAIADGRSPAPGLAGAAVLFALAVALSYRAPAPAAGRGKPPAPLQLLLLGLALLPFVLEPVRRRLTGAGDAPEVLTVLALRNLGLGLAALAAWPLCLRLSALASLFLMLFAVTMTGRPCWPSWGCTPPPAAPG